MFTKLYYNIKKEQKAIDYGEFPILIPSKRRKEKRKVRSISLFLVFICIILLVVCFFYLVKIKYTVNGMKYYCFCAYTTLDKEKAEQYAREVQLKGGAGYLYEEDKYYIIASVYNDKQRAESIAKKNNGSMILCEFPSLSFVDKTKANELKKLYEKIDKYARFLIELSYSLDSGKESLQGVQGELKNYENDIKEEDHAVFSMLTPFLENVYEGVKVKYYICDIIFTTYKYFLE